MFLRYLGFFWKNFPFLVCCTLLCELVCTKCVLGSVEMCHCRNLLYFLCVNLNLFTFPHPFSYSPLQLWLARGNRNALFKTNSVILSLGDVLWWWNFQLPLVNSKEDFAASEEAQRQNTQHSGWKRTQMRLASWCPRQDFFPLASAISLAARPLLICSVDPEVHHRIVLLSKAFWWDFNVAVAPFFLEE